MRTHGKVSLDAFERLERRVAEMHATIATTSRNCSAEVARANAAEARVRELEAAAVALLEALEPCRHCPGNGDACACKPTAAMRKLVGR